MINYSDQGVVWYAMKTTYQKELKAKEYLDTHGIKCFIPMQQSVVTKMGRKTTIFKPAIHNLIFVKTDIKQLTEIKCILNYLHNHLATESGVLSPIIVPTVQMDQFIRAVTLLIDNITYIDLTTETIAKGTMVRITDGAFKGYEGILHRIKGKRDRRVEISVKGVAAYRVDVDASYIEKI